MARRSDSLPPDTRNDPLKTPDAPCTVSWAVCRMARCSAEPSELSDAAKQIEATEDHFGVALAAAAVALALAAAAVAAEAVGMVVAVGRPSHTL